MRVSRLGSVALLALMLTAAAVSGPRRAQAETYGTVLDALSATGKHTMLLQAIKTAGLEERLKGSGPFTVFAPDDAAWKAVSQETRDAWMKDPARLKSVLLYHVVGDRVPASRLVAHHSEKTLNGARVPVVFKDGIITVGGAEITRYDVQCGNGVVYVVNHVLTPPEK